MPLEKPLREVTTCISLRDYARLVILIVKCFGIETLNNGAIYIKLHDTSENQQTRLINLVLINVVLMVKKSRDFPIAQHKM